MNQLISVIVPVYNTAAYLDKCLNSLLAQTYPDFEIILVDDGSTDNSMEICRSFESGDTRIRVFSKANGGLSSARNYGIAHSTGEFVVFLDSDDWFEPDMLEKLIEGANENGADVVIQGFHVDFENEGYTTDNVFPDNKFFSGENYHEGIVYAERPGLLNSACNKLYKKSILDDSKLEFQLGAEPAEDLIFNCSYFAKASSVLCLQYAGYHYIKKDAQTLTVKYMPNYEEKLSVFHETRRALYDSVKMPEKIKNELLANCNASYMLTAVSNIYREASPLKFKERTRVFKFIYSQKDLTRSMLSCKHKNSFIRIMKLCARTKSAFISNLIFSVLFFGRYKFSRLYAKIRKKVLYGEKSK